MKNTITREQIDSFRLYLIEEEKSALTVEKYLRDVRRYAAFAAGREISKDLTIEYKNELKAEGYAVRSINSMLISVFKFLDFIGRGDARVKTLRVQREVFCPEDKELSREEYVRLVKAAEKKPRVQLILETIAGTGIRVSELRFFTVEAVSRGEINVDCKRKNRKIFIPSKLRKKLLDYAKRNNITSGVIFRCKNGKPLDRSMIWAEMKKLCREAEVKASKVFPHNLRKLFARIFYKLEKDIAKLADILGHSSIDTTRIYILTSGAEHKRCIERMKLVI